MRRSARERDYIAALQTLFAEHDTTDPSHAPAKLRESDGGAREAISDDDEALIHYALALNIAASPSDRTYALPLRAASIWSRSSAQAAAPRRSPTYPCTATTILP